MPDRYIYETEEGETFVMCWTCVERACTMTGEFQCAACHQWYVVSHPDGELVIARLYDRDTEDLPHA